MARNKRTGEGVSIPIHFELQTDEALKDLEKFAKDTNANISGFAAAKRILDGLEKSMKNAFDGKGVDKFSDKLLRMQEAASGSAKKLLGMSDRFKEVFERQQIRDEWGSAEKLKELEAAYRAAQDRRRAVLAEYAQLTTSGAKEGIGDKNFYDRMVAGANEARATLHSLLEKKKELEKDGGKGTDEWKRITEAITSARRSINGYEVQKKRALDPSVEQAAKARWAELDKELEEANNTIRQYAVIQRAMQAQAVDMPVIEQFMRLIAVVKSAELEMHNLENAEKRLGGKDGTDNMRRGFYLMRTIIRDMEKGLRKISDKMTQFAKSVANAAKKMLGLNKESSRTTKGLNDGFRNALRNILRYGFGIRSLYFLFRRLRGYAKEALDEMAKQLPFVNAQMSRAAQAINQMKGSLGTMIQPLLNVLVPVLEKVAALITKIANLIGGVFAILTGQGKIYKATAGAVDYAASLDKTGAAAKKAKKELEGYLSPIDEINKYQSKRDDDEDDSGGGADAGPAFTFEELEPSNLAKKVADVIQRLIEPIKKAWANMGNFVRTSWRYALNELKKLGESVARDFWRVWEEYDTQRIFQNLFEAVGWIGQAVGNLAKRFREAWDENDTGYRILAAIRDIILIISEHIKDAAKATAEWADELDFGPLLTAFADWLESLEPVIDNIAGILEDFYEQVLLPLGEWAIEEGGPALLQVFTDFNEKVDWEGLRSKLSELWTHLEPFAERVGEGLIQFIDDISEKVADFLNSEELSTFLQKLGEWMDNITADDVTNGLWDLVKAFVMLKGAVTGLSILGNVAVFIKELGIGLKALEGLGGIGTVLSTLGGITAVISGLVLSIKEFFDMWKNGWDGLSTILEALGIALVTIGVIILAPIEGIGIAIAAAIAAIVFAISQIVIIVHDNWDAIKQFFIDLWDGIVEVWNTVTDWFKSNIIDPLVSFWEGFSSRVKAIFEGLWIIIKAIWIVVSTWFNQHVIQPVINFFSPIVAKIAGFFQTLWNNIKSIWSVVANWFNKTIIDPVKSAFNTFTTAVAGFFNTLWNGIKSGAKAAINGVIGFIEGGINGMIDKINFFLNLFNTAVGWAASITGDSWSGVSLIPHVSLPRLAQGAVIPPNREFMAVLGDQKSGTNIETPLSTMVEAFNQALSQNGGSGRTEINFLLPDRRKIAQYVIEGGRVMQTSTGRNPFELA